MMKNQSVKRTKRKSKAWELVFDNELQDVVLGLLGKETNEEGFIIDENGNQALTPQGQPVRSDEFGAIAKGSEIFIKKDIDSLIKYIESGLE